MWLTESNRLKHFLYGIGTGYIGTLIFTAGLAAGMEFKDRVYGNSWDWLDFIATILGGLIGQVLQVLTILFII